MRPVSGISLTMDLPINDVALSVLPPDVASAIRGLVEVAKRQEALIRELRQALHGKKSEKLSEDERQLVFEGLGAAISEVEIARDASPMVQQAGQGKRPPVKRNIGNLPAHLPRIEEVIEPETLNCPCGCGEMHKIGEDRSERLDIIPSQFRVIVTVRPKYACRSYTDGATQTLAPAHLIKGALLTEALIAHVLVSKYADHLLSVMRRVWSTLNIQRAGPCFCPWSARRHKMRTMKGGRLLGSTSGSWHYGQIRAHPVRRPCPGRHTVTRRCRILMICRPQSGWRAGRDATLSHATAKSLAEAGG